MDRQVGLAVGEVWLGLVIVLLLMAGVRLRASWMPRATVAAAVVVLFALIAINPDALMAWTLLARLDGPYPVDYQYLSGLSADAASGERLCCRYREPALVRREPVAPRCVRPLRVHVRALPVRRLI